MTDSPSISNLVSTWDTSVAGVLNGRSTLPAHLDAWLASLRQSYPQASATASLPEPFLGRLDRRPAAVFLAATAGRAYVGSHGRPDFQSLTGVFANEVRELGSYSAWAATWTYFRRPWTSLVSANNIHHRRLQFLRHWHGDDRLDPEDMVTFALYPWHTSALTTRLYFDADLLWTFVFEPIVALGSPPVFTFGRPWFSILPTLGFSLESLVAMGRGNRQATSRTKAVATFRGPSGLQIFAERHPGSPYPPPIEGVTQMQKALANIGTPVP